MVLSVLLAACCAICLPVALLQVVPAPNKNTEYCHVSPEDLRVLPTSGFTRSVLASFTTTTLAGSQNAVPQVADLGNCLFQSYDPAFDELIGNNRTLYQVGPTKDAPWAVESPTYLPETDEIIFASYFVSVPSNVSRVNLDTGEVTVVPISPSIGGAGGSTSYLDGQVVFGTVGDAFDDANPPGIFIVDPYEGNSTAIANNFFGIRFNGWDDVQSLSDGSVIGTDTNYTSDTKNYSPFKNPAVLPNDVWIFPPDGPPRVLIDGLASCPNGVAVSPDEKILYISVGALTADDPFATTLVDVLYAFDLVKISGGTFATNKRVHAKSDNQYFDGIAVSQSGNIYGTTGDGIAVFSPGGVLLGKIIIPTGLPIANHPTNSVTLAGDRLIIMHNLDIYMLPINDSNIAFAAGA